LEGPRFSRAVPVQTDCGSSRYGSLLSKQTLFVDPAEPTRHSPVLSRRSPKTNGARKFLPLLFNL